MTVLARLRTVIRSGAAAVALLAGIGWAGPVMAANYAVVVGIDGYTAPIPALQGAVNDAKDVAQALQKYGAEVVLITNEQATKANVVAAWEQELAKAKAGDTLFFTYAGHGSQEPAKPNDPDEPDGLDENLPLVNYQQTGPGLAERIVDNEVSEWLAEAKAKKVHVVFMTDACHSGTMFRSLSLNITYRKVNKPKIDRSELLKFAPPAPNVPEAIGPNDDVTFLAGVSDDRLVPEVEIDGQPRGALSWSFARALEGAADENHDGVVSEKELIAFVRASVLQHTDSQQISQSFPPVSRDIAVFKLKGAGADLPDDLKNAISVAQQDAATGLLNLAYRGGDGPAQVEGATIVSDPEAADFVYDVDKGTVEKRVAGIVAENVKPEGLPGIMAKWRAIAFLNATATGGSVPFEIASGPRTYKRGEKLTVTLGHTGHHYMTLFNLPPDGKVEFLYPGTRQERDEDWTGKPFKLPLLVRDPPFGAEHLIAILSDQPLDQLHTALKTLTSANAAIVLPDTLKNALAGQTVTIGIGNIFTSAGE